MTLMKKMKEIMTLPSNLMLVGVGYQSVKEVENTLPVIGMTLYGVASHWLRTAIGILLPMSTHPIGNYSQIILTMVMVRDSGNVNIHPVGVSILTANAMIMMLATG